MKRKSDRLLYQEETKNKNVIIQIEPPSLYGKREILSTVFRFIMGLIVFATVIFGIVISFYSIIMKNV